MSRSKRTEPSVRYTSITGWGKCLPPAVLANADLEQLTDTSDEWIITRTGIKERRISHVEVSDLGTVAGLRAVAAAGLEPTDIDFIITATCSPDRLIPSAASVIQEKMGAVNAGAMDLNAACSGWIYGLSVAHSMVASKAMDRVLIIGVEKLHFWLNFTDRSTSVLFGDGAGAVLLEPSRRRAGVLAVELGSDGSVADILCVGGSGTEGEPGKAPPPWITMEGPEVFRRAVVAMGDASLRVVEEAGLKLEDVDLLIPHQANVRIIDATARRLKLAPEQVYVNIASYGNTSAATIPIALTEALEEGRVKPGDHIVFAAFGGGLTWAAAVFRWGDRVTPLGTTDVDLPPTDKTARELLQPNIDLYGLGIPS